PRACSSLNWRESRGARRRLREPLDLDASDETSRFAASVMSFERLSIETQGRKAAKRREFLHFCASPRAARLTRPEPRCDLLFTRCERPRQTALPPAGFSVASRPRRSSWASQPPSPAALPAARPSLGAPRRAALPGRSTTLLTSRCTRTSRPTSP